MSTYPLQVQAWQGPIFFTPNMPPIIPYHRTIEPWIIIVASSKSSGHMLHLWQDPAGMLLAALPRGRSADLRAFQKKDEEESKDYSNFNDTNELISCCTKRRRQEWETAWPIFQVPQCIRLANIWSLCTAGLCRKELEFKTSSADLTSVQPQSENPPKAPPKMPAKTTCEPLRQAFSFFCIQWGLTEVPQARAERLKAGLLRRSWYTLVPCCGFHAFFAGFEWISNMFK